MKIKSISELNEAKQAPAKTLFKMVVKGSTSEIEGVKISKEMAQAALDWFDGSVYARKYEKQVKTAGMGAVAPLIFGDNWGIKKRIPSKLKAEFKELQAQYKRALPENESVVNEGQFSWMTYDTDVQIGSERENTIDVYMFDNEGNQWHEKKYDGYGVFGNMDYYELLAKMNGFTEEDLEDKSVLKAIRAMGKAEMRDIGIALAFDPKGKKIKTKAKGNKVLFPALVENPKFDWKRHDFSEESESDPNQSWYQEPDYDEDYEDDEDYEQGWYESNNLFPTFNDYININENKFSGIADLVKSLHFEIDPKTAEEKKIEIGYRQGEVTKRKQIEGGEYSLRRFRKEIKYGDGTYLGVFTPGSYDAAVSSLGDGPHAKKVKKVKWNQRKYDKWVSDLAYDNDGGGQDSSYGFEMAQNAKHEPGLIDFVKRSNRGEDPLQRIQWDIEAAMESVVNEAVAKNTKVYQIATPAPKAMLVGELEDLFGDDYRHIVTEFDDNEGYESVLVFNLTKSDIKRIQEEIGDVLIWEYSIKKGKAISESLTEAKGFKNTIDFEKFLIEIDGMRESQIKKIMGKDYIDTPGFYQDEKGNYDNDIIEFMISNMGDSEFEKLQDWWESNVAESVVSEAKHSSTDFSKPGNDGDIYFSKREGDAVGVKQGDKLQMIYVFQKEPKLGKIQKSDKRWENMGPASEKLLIDLRGREDGKILFDFVSTLEESVNEAKVSLEKIKEFASKHLRFLSTSEEFDGTEGGLWASAEDGDMYKGKRIYDYYSEDYKNYTFGVLNKWENELNKRGYYSEYYDAGTVMIWEQ